MTWPAPTVRSAPLSQSTPTANTQELGLLVLSFPVGAPELACDVALAPIPVALLYAMTVIFTPQPLNCSAAVTRRLCSLPTARATQTSASPRPVLSRPTKVHFSPLADTVADWCLPAGALAATKATSRSPAAVVDTLAVAELRACPLETVSMTGLLGATGVTVATSARHPLAEALLSESPL